jgi:hypothetical protein
VTRALVEPAWRNLCVVVLVLVAAFTAGCEDGRGFGGGARFKPDIRQANEETERGEGDNGEAGNDDNPYRSESPYLEDERREEASERLERNNENEQGYSRPSESRESNEVVDDDADNPYRSNKAYLEDERREEAQQRLEQSNENEE